MPMWNPSTGPSGQSDWTPIGSGRWQRPKRTSRLGGRNIMRAVLTGLWAKGRRTNLPMRSRLAATSWLCKKPKTHPRFGTKNRGRSRVHSLSLPLVQKMPVTSRRRCDHTRCRGTPIFRRLFQSARWKVIDILVECRRRASKPRCGKEPDLRIRNQLTFRVPTAARVSKKIRSRTFLGIHFSRKYFSGEGYCPHPRGQPFAGCRRRYRPPVASMAGAQSSSA